jgi:hypothetical protein
MSASIIFTDQHAPDGRTIRYNVDISTADAAQLVWDHYQDGSFIPIPNEDGGEHIYVNPERVASITPAKEV